jgi:hypothetical protein
MEDLDLAIARRMVETADLAAALGLVGVAPGRHDDAQRMLIDEREEARFSARQTILDDDLEPGSAEAALDEGRLGRSVAVLRSVATVTPFPAASPSALTTIGAPWLAIKSPRSSFGTG